MVNTQEPSEFPERKRKTGVTCYLLHQKQLKGNTTKMTTQPIAKDETQQKCRKNKLFGKHITRKWEITLLKHGLFPASLVLTEEAGMRGNGRVVHQRQLS